MPNDGNRSGIRANQGPGQGGGRGGAGRGSGQGFGGVSACFCPNCGHEEPHQRGTPCVQKSCPSCGTRMVGKR